MILGELLRERPGRGDRKKKKIIKKSQAKKKADGDLLLVGEGERDQWSRKTFNKRPAQNRQREKRA